MHNIQRKILSLLMYAPSLTYAAMRPKGVESNHFAYHLEQLVKGGLVLKQDRNYSLSPEGLALADRVSHTDMSVRKQPHIVTASYITNDVGQVLLFKHTFQPYMNLYGYVQGRIHYEESVAEAASREVVEKTGLSDVALTHRGIAYITATQQEATISKLVAHVFTGKVTGSPDITTGSQKGTASWEALSLIEPQHCMPGFLRIKQLIESSDDFFFAELTDELASRLATREVTSM